MGHINIDNLFFKANSLLRKGQNEEAIDIYKNLLLKFPSNSRAKEGMKKIGVLMTPQFENKLNQMLEKGHFKDVIKYTEQLINNFPDNFVFWQFSGIANLKLNNLEKAENDFQNATILAPKNPNAFYNLAFTKKLLLNYNQAIEFFNKAINIKPDYFESYLEIAEIYKNQKEFKNAILNYKKALSINSNLVSAYNNLSVIFKIEGDYEDSLCMVQKAIFVAPEKAELYNNLGVTLEKLNKFEDAEKAYLKAISINKHLPEAYNNLGNILKKNNHYEKSLDAYSRSIALNPKLTEALENMGDCLSNIVFTQYKPEVRDAIIRLLEKENLVRLSSISRAITSFLKFEIKTENILKSLKIKNSLNNVNKIVAELNKNQILINFLNMSILPDLEFEKIFTILRSIILRDICDVSMFSDILNFQPILAIQCHINEYIFEETVKENDEIKKLEIIITSNLKNNIQPDFSLILCLASYRPLNTYSWSNLIIFPDEFINLKKIFIDDYNFEKKLEKTINSFKKISNKVSNKVKNQYEENPYPRWKNLRIFQNSLSIFEFCEDINLKINDISIYNIVNPKILIAGCGTGYQSITAASLYKNSQILAVDLSFKSLSYAKRKTQELDFKNITYMQADILNTQYLEDKFDIIECAGVLHHMEDPTKGWEALVSSLKPGGLMKIGLYSKLARHSISKTREEISKINKISQISDIKKFRKKIINSKLDHHKSLTKSSDFYNLSNFRDLLFHVQEYHYTIPEIKNSLSKLGLKFCGFEIDQFILSEFNKKNNEKDFMYDLDKWNEFEKCNKHTFGSMYQFWCQKTE